MSNNTWPIITRNVETKKTSWNNNSKTFIMLHHTWWSLIFDNQFKALSENLNVKASCHYVIWQEWEIWQIWNDNQVLWHAWTWNNIQWYINNMNVHSIWIELVSDWKLFTNKQRQSTIILVKHLMAKYDISIENVIRHLDYSHPRKIDVWDNFWNHKYKSFKDWKETELKDCTKTNRYYHLLESRDFAKTIFDDFLEQWNLNAWEIKTLIAIWIDRARNNMIDLWDIKKEEWIFARLIK